MIGLTGSIGMGKSETSRLFAEQGVPVFDADATIHELYAAEAAALVEKAFPGTTRGGAVDRAALSKKVTGKPAALKKLEALMHPLVAQKRDAFLKQAGVPVDFIRLAYIGIHGNGHFLMLEKNNLEIAAVIADWLARRVTPSETADGERTAQ